MTAKNILKNICRDNTYLLDVPEVQEIEVLIDSLLTTIPTQEQFDTILDLSMFLHKSKIDRTIDCLHYLGDRAQIWYYNNGWIPYRLKHDCYTSVCQKPSMWGKYLVCRRDGKIHFETWNGTSWAYNDGVIIYWQEIPKVPNFKLLK